MKIVIEHTGAKVNIVVTDETYQAGGQIVAKCGGATLSEAVAWTIRRVNRIADEVERRLVEMNLIDEAQIEALLAEVESQVEPETD